MKKIILVLVAIIASLSIFSSCSGDSQKSYRVTNNLSYSASSDPYLNNTLYEVIVFQYKGSDIIKQDNLGTITYGGGSSKIMDAEDNCEKIRVSFRFLPPESQFYNLSSNNRIYTVSYYYLKEEEIKEINLEESTMVTTILKSCINNSSIKKALTTINKKVL